MSETRDTRQGRESSYFQVRLTKVRCMHREMRCINHVIALDGFRPACWQRFALIGVVPRRFARHITSMGASIFTYTLCVKPDLL